MTAGVRGEYFTDPDLTHLAFTRVDPTINFNWGLESPDPRPDVDDFSVRWTGQLRVEVDDTYTFEVVSDDGVRLWIDGTLVIDYWQIGGASNVVLLALTAGLHDLKLEFFAGAGEALVQLFWSSPSTPHALVPQDHLVPPGTRTAPVLFWTGERNYLTDGLDPKTGDATTSFTYHVLYTDADGDAPMAGSPRVHILASGQEITDSPFAMTHDSGDFAMGAVYTYSTTLPEGSYRYYFDARDTTGLQAVAPPLLPTPTAPIAGPHMYGDVNGDGHITPADALMAFRYFLGLIPLDMQQQHRADISRDGRITPADALCIFQTFLQLSPRCFH